MILDMTRFNQIASVSCMPGGGMQLMLACHHVVTQSWRSFAGWVYSELSSRCRSSGCKHMVRGAKQKCHILLNQSNAMVTQSWAGHTAQRREPGGEGRGTRSPLLPPSTAAHAPACIRTRSASSGFVRRGLWKTNTKVLFKL